jgi:hypothetical protein
MTGQEKRPFELLQPAAGRSGELALSSPSRSSLQLASLFITRYASGCGALAMELARTAQSLPPLGLTYLRLYPEACLEQGQGPQQSSVDRRTSGATMKAVDTLVGQLHSRILERRKPAAVAFSP